MKILICICMIILLIISCDTPPVLKSNKKRFISIAKYEPSKGECCDGILLDSTGFFYHSCLYSKNASDLNKKTIISDDSAFKFVNELDTNSLRKLELCTSYKGKWSGYFYEVFYDYGNTSSSIVFRDQVSACDTNLIIPKLGAIFKKNE